ncbi:MAG: V-type ATP synthase subunit I [Candidatus Muiribacteriota bacterium]
MAIAKVSKLGIAVLKEKKSQLIRLLHKYGNIEIIEEKNQNEIENTQYNDEYVKINNALELLNEYSEKKGFMEMFSPKKEYSLDELEDFSKSEKKKIAFNLNELKEKRKKLEGNLNSLQTTLEKLKNWEWLEIDLNIIKKWQYASLKTITGKVENLEILKNELQNKNLKYELIAKQSGNIFHGALIYLKSDDEIIYKLIGESGINLEEFEKPGLISKQVKEIKEELAMIQEEVSQIDEEILSLNSAQDELGLVLDSIALLIQEQKVNSSFYNTEYASFVKVWVPKGTMESLRKELSEKIKEIEIMEIPLDEDEEPPVLFAGNNFTTPFHLITNMYDAPTKKDFDPTPLFAPFFVIFFGFCLSDAGYGLIIILTSLFFVFNNKISNEAKQPAKLLLYCGFSTFVLGAMAGGWFGILIEEINNPLAKFLTRIKIVDPNRDSLIVLGFGLLLGAVQILWSKLISAYKNFLNKEPGETISDIVWFLYLCFFFPTVLKYAGYIEGHAWIYRGFFYMALIILVVKIIRSKANLFLKPLHGLLELYDTIGYLGDVLSYSRLMALGMATGGIALAVNLISGIVGDMIPVVGIFVQIVLLVVGHTFNIIMNMLGSFVHSLRLQFVEFFRKFFDGGGRTLKPFKTEFKYIKVKE